MYFDAYFKTEHDHEFTKLKLGLAWAKLIDFLATQGHISFTIVPHGVRVKSINGWPKDGSKPVMTGEIYESATRTKD